MATLDGVTRNRMSKNVASLIPFLEPLKSLQNLLEHYPHKGLIIGGIAASLLGTPRLTADVDALSILSIDDIPELFQRAKEVGFTPRLDDAEEFARKRRVLLLKYVESGISIDLSLGLLPVEEEAVANSQPYFLEGGTLQLPKLEDLIIMKAIGKRSGAGRDWFNFANREHLQGKNSVFFAKERSFWEKIEPIWLRLRGNLNVYGDCSSPERYFGYTGAYSKSTKPK